MAEWWNVMETTKVLDEGQEEGSRRGAGDVADAANDGGDESLEAGDDSHEGNALGAVEAPETTGDGGKHGAEDEGEGDDGVDVDAHEAGGVVVDGNGAHGLADAGVANEELQGDEADGGGTQDDEVLGDDADAQEMLNPGDRLAGVADFGVEKGVGAEEGDVAEAPVDLQQVLNEEGNADGGDEGGEPGCVAQGTVGDAFHGVAEGAADDHRRQDAQDSHPPGLVSAEGASEGNVEDLGGIGADEGADHEDIAVGEVDEAEDAVDHRVAEGDECVEGAIGEGDDYFCRNSDIGARTAAGGPWADVADRTDPSTSSA